MIKNITVTVPECTCDHCQQRWVPKLVLVSGQYVAEVPTYCKFCRRPGWNHNSKQVISVSEAGVSK